VLTRVHTKCPLHGLCSGYSLVLTDYSWGTLTTHSSTCAWMGVGLSNLLLVIQSSTRFESPHWPRHGTGFDACE
jgi:hypothetical protein